MDPLTESSSLGIPILRCFYIYIYIVILWIVQFWHCFYLLLSIVHFENVLTLTVHTFLKCSKWAVIFSDSISGNKDFETTSTLISQNTSIGTSGMICIVWFRNIYEQDIKCYCCISNIQKLRQFYPSCTHSRGQAEYTAAISLGRNDYVRNEEGQGIPF